MKTDRHSEQVMFFRRDDQANAVKATVSEFEVADRATVVQPCGSGKTMVGLWVHEDMGSRMTVVFVPSIALMEQTANRFLGQSKSTALNVYGVCSDLTINNKADELQFKLGELGFEVGTDRQDVRRFLKGQADVPGECMVFCTYQSVQVLADAMGDDFAFELGIFDEAHKTSGNADGDFSLALDDANLRIGKRLFMTATPKLYNYSAKRKADDNAIVLYSMDDEAVYGRVVYRLTVKDAIDAGIISDYRLLVVCVDPNEVPQHALSRAEVEHKGRKESLREIALRTALHKAMTEYSAEKAFVFHSRIADSARFAERYAEDYPDTTALHVQGSMSASERAGIIEAFAGSVPPSVLSNARCLCEGVDVPAVDMVMFANAKTSKVDIVQTAGRAWRIHKGDGTDMGYIVVPVFTDAVENIDDHAKAKGFNEILTVLGALRDEDERIDADIKLLNERLAASPGEPICDLGSYVRFVGYPIHVEKLAGAISTYCVEKISGAWEVSKTRYRAFYDRHGRWPKLGSSGHEKHLAHWGCNQRSTRFAGKLHNVRIDALDAIGFVWDQEQDSLFRKVAEVIAFRKLEGRWPSCSAPNEQSLGHFCSGIRTPARKAKLSEDQIAELDALGFLWNPAKDKFEQQINELIEYRIAEGRWPKCRVKNRREYMLYGFASRLRKKTFVDGRLAQRHIDKLNEYGFDWSDEIKSPYQERLSEYIQFRAENGRWPTYKGMDKRERLLADMARIIRGRGKEKVDISERDREALDRFGFRWEQDTLTANVNALISFRIEKGKWPTVKNNHPNGEENILGRFASKLRGTYRNKLSINQVKKLLSLGFLFSTNKIDRNFTNLVQFKIREGRWPSAPSKDKSELSLSWFQSSIRHADKHRLSQEQIDKLNELGFVWDRSDPVPIARAIVDYFISENRWPVYGSETQEESRLGTQVKKMRKMYREGRIPKEAFDVLNEAGFEWAPKSGPRS